MRSFFGEYSGTDQLTLEKFLQTLAKLPPDTIQSALRKGAVTIQRGGRGKILRERNPSLILKSKDKVWLHFDQKVLSFPEFQNPELIGETSHYGVWFKPAGIMSQGNQAGDHTSILRAVELKKRKEVYLVHRLDRETAGLMLIAYNSKAAHALSELFQKNAIEKTYEAIVVGELKEGYRDTIDASLDGKKAITHFEVLISERGLSLLRIKIETGRLHQIRRHLDHIGLPVLGDPKYGKNNKNRDGLKLLARSVKFIDPWSKSEVSFTYPDSLEF